jgi:hypothetical protein
VGFTDIGTWLHVRKYVLTATPLLDVFGYWQEVFLELQFA